VAPIETSSAPVGDVANGRAIYARSCAVCHGPNGEGTAIAPDALNDASLLVGLTDEDLESTIRMGVDGKMAPMPNLSDQDVADLMALLRSWQ
jgi:cytochrome c oxidase cbb3-type subunit 3